MNIRYFWKKIDFLLALKCQIINGTANGNVGTLLYVHGNERALKNKEGDCYTIAELTERFVCGGLSFEEAVEIAQERK